MRVHGSDLEIDGTGTKWSIEDSAREGHDLLNRQQRVVAAQEQTDLLVMYVVAMGSLQREKIMESDA